MIEHKILPQIVTAVSFIQNHSDAGNFYQHLVGAQNSSQQTQILHDMYALGTRSSWELAKDKYAALADTLGYIPDSRKVLAFTRLKKGKQIFHSSAYKKVTVRNSYAMLYWLGKTHDNFGQIMYFFNIKRVVLGLEVVCLIVPVMLLIMSLFKSSFLSFSCGISTCTGFKIHVAQEFSFHSDCVIGLFFCFLS